MDKFFWRKVIKTDSCWLWSGSKSKTGYGNVCRNKKTVLTHRYSWEIHNGTIPDGLNVLHKCDIPNCVRPDHLFLGSQQDNMQDRSSKGRMKSVIGKDNPHSKLSETDVISIRAKYAQKNCSQQMLANEYSVSKTMIRYIIQRKSWSHI